jgi:hypothetical protein
MMQRTRNPADQVHYDRAWESLYTSVWGGTRHYSTFPTIYTDDRINRPVATLFTISSVIKRDDLDELISMEFGPYKDRKRHTKNYVAPDLMLNRLRDAVKEYTWSTRKNPISARVNHMWPDSPFSEWLEKEHQYHWATARWEGVKGNDGYMTGIWLYQFDVTVHAPIMSTPEEYSDAWGEAIVMTKMMDGLEYQGEDNG